MTVIMHRSTDRGALALTGQQGSMGALLNEILCKGSNPSAPDSVQVALPYIQITKTNHGFLEGQVVTASGADQPEYNGNHVVHINSPDVYYYEIATNPAALTGTLMIGGQRTAGIATSVTRSGTTVTVVMAGHGFAVNSRAYLQEAVQPEYNGWKTIATVPDANTFTFELLATQTPATPATGSIYVRYGNHGMGWTRPFTGTNKSIFQQGIDGAKVQGVLICTETDASSHTFGAGLAFAEGATALGTYVNPMYATENAAYSGMLKSGTADAVARKWIVIGDHRTIMILTQPISGTTYNPNGWMISYFGDFISYIPGDIYPIMSAPAYRCPSYAFNNPAQVGTSSSATSYGFANYANYNTIWGTQDTYYPARVSRNHLGYVGYINVTLLSIGSWPMYYSNACGQFSLGSRAPSYSVDIFPDPVHGGFNLDKLYLTHPATGPNTGNAVVRGEIRGLWNPLHRRSQVSTWANNDTFDGTGELAGKSFEIFDLHGDGSNPTGWFIVETSDTWSA